MPHRGHETRRRAGLLLAFTLLAPGCGTDPQQPGTPFTAVWDFGVAADYRFDPERIEVAAGAARLRPLDLAADFPDAFAHGTADGTVATADGLVPETVPWPDPGTLLPHRKGELTGLWRMDEAAWNGTVDEVRDDSGAGRHGVRLGDADTVARSESDNRAGRFDGAGDGVRIDATGRLGTHWSIALWFSPDRIVGAGRRALLSFWSGGALQLGLHYAGDPTGTVAAGSLYLADGAGGVTATAGGSLDEPRHAGAWIHLVVVHDPAGTRFYLDGRPLRLAGDTAALATDFDRIRFARGGDPAEDYAGRLDEIALWDTALDEEDVQRLAWRSRARVTGMFTAAPLDAGCDDAAWEALEWRTDLPYLKGLPGSQGNESSADYPALVGSTGNTGDDDLMTGLVALWHLNALPPGPVADGIRFPDASGNGRQAVVHNPGGTIRAAPGRFARGLHFTSTGGDHVVTDFHPDSPTGTLSAWFRLDDLSLPNPLNCPVGAHDGSHRFYLCIGSAGYGGKRVTVGYGDAYASFGTPPVDRRWYHLALTGDGATARVYLDGREIGRFAYRFPAGTSSDPFLIGAKTYKGQIPNNEFGGIVDEVAVWNRALNAAEIRQLYRRGADRIRLQVRACAQADCGDRAQDPAGGWQGVGGVGGAFSELHNDTRIDSHGTGVGTARATPPYLALGALLPNPPKGRYLQWRVLLAADDEHGLCSGGACLPELRRVTLQPRSGDLATGAPLSRHTCGGAAVENREPLRFRTLAGFTVRARGACTYRWQLSNDGGVRWLHPTAAGWQPAVRPEDAGATEAVARAIGSFPRGEGRLRFRAWLVSDGWHACSLERVELQGTR